MIELLASVRVLGSENVSEGVHQCKLNLCFRFFVSFSDERKHSKKSRDKDNELFAGLLRFEW